MIRRRTAARGPLRSMDWLRGAGLAHRVRAVILLVAFAVGSILARDVALVQHATFIQAALQSPATEASPALIGRDDAAPRAKVRPSGLSRREAMNPWDPPDDDDEVDEDSDTVAASHATLAVLPAARADVASAAFVTRAWRPTVVRSHLRRVRHRAASPRAPPV